MKNFLKGLVIAAITAIIDQYSKFWVFAFLLGKETDTLNILPFFNLVMVRNFGVSFGMFNDLPYGHVLLSLVALFITAMLLIWMWRENKFYMSIALGLIIGGAVGNITDRVRMGAVADFLDFYIAGYHWPAFNVADSAVFIGVVMILLENFFTKHGDKNAK